jgi:hypothetical protein
MALSGWALYRRRNVSPVRYELAIYISDGGLLDSRRRENLNSYIRILTVYVPVQSACWSNGKRK